MKLLFLLLVLTSCAIAPARVKRVMNDRASLPELIELALHEPESREGKLALGHFIERWQAENGQAKGEISGAKGRRYRLTFAESEFGAYPLSYFDSIRPAADFEVVKIAHHRREGTGTPLAALRENKQREALERFYPPEAITRPLTAILTPGAIRDGARDLRIELLCPLVNASVSRGGISKPLAADFSVPWALFLERTGKLNQLRVLDMITRAPAREPRLYLMEPYDPKKEPLIMIHGLLSTPLAWAQLSHELWTDDRLRDRYQIWHYLYNTSAPALYSARQLRAQLRELRQQLDPQGDDAALRRMTLLTHSMGGLIGKALAVEPGEVFWKAAFKVPHDTLKLSPEDRATLKEAFEWQAEPAIHRIIFIAVPHRGSDFADNIIGRVGSWLTRPPGSFQTFYERISAANPGVFTPEYELLGSGKLDSVNALSPRQPTLRILAELPLAHPVKTHSIIGDRGKDGPKEQSSDGIVPYLSSHLKDSLSELLVPEGHGAFKHPAAVEEVRRILSLPD